MDYATSEVLYDMLRGWALGGCDVFEPSEGQGSVFEWQAFVVVNTRPDHGQISLHLQTCPDDIRVIS